MRQTSWDPYADDHTAKLPSCPDYEYGRIEHNSQGAWATEGGYYDYVPSEAAQSLVWADTPPYQPTRGPPEHEMSHGYSSGALEQSRAVSSFSRSSRLPSSSSNHPPASSHPPNPRRRASIACDTKDESIVFKLSRPRPSPQSTPRRQGGEPLSSPSRTYHANSAHPRSPTPPFKPGIPSDFYFAQSIVPSKRLASPSRKLLVLDLNGTLVFRPPTSSPAVQREVHPRPYMSTFAKFIARHPTIQTMVWSSAQPHNVKKMVDVAFADGKSSLVHIWARDTLGLSQFEFGRKVQTVKNLEKLWEGLGALSDGEPTFSERDTILLDDSALKAHMQPYNHLIVPEYEGKMRRADLAALDQIRKDPGPRPGEPGRAGSSVEEVADEPRVDQTLLAVVGILDEAAMQDNVCGWIRAGGLLADPFTSTDKELEAIVVPQEFSEMATLVENNDPAPMDGVVQAPQVSTPGESGREGDEPGAGAGSPLIRHAKRKRKKLKAVQPASVPPEWYQNKPSLDYWVGRGIQTLKALDIPVEHGIRKYYMGDDSGASYSESSGADQRPTKRVRGGEFDERILPASEHT